MSIEQRVLSVLSEVLGEQIDIAAGTRQLQDYQTWDSLAHATALLALEEEFQVTLSPEALTSEMTIQDVIGLIALNRA